MRHKKFNKLLSLPINDQIKDKLLKAKPENVPLTIWIREVLETKADQVLKEKD